MQTRARKERDESCCLDGALTWAIMSEEIWGMKMHFKRTEGYVTQWRIGKSVVKATILYSFTAISMQLKYGVPYFCYPSYHVWRQDDLRDIMQLHRRRLCDPRTRIRGDCSDGQIRVIINNVLDLRIDNETTARQMRSTIDQRFRNDTTTRGRFGYKSRTRLRRNGSLTKVVIARPGSTVVHMYELWLPGYWQTIFVNDQRTLYG